MSWASWWIDWLKPDLVDTTDIADTNDNIDTNDKITVTATKTPDISTSLEDQDLQLSVLEKRKMQEIIETDIMTQNEKQNLLLEWMNLWGTIFDLKNLLEEFYLELIDNSYSIDGILDWWVVDTEIIELFTSIINPDNHPEKTMIVQTLAVINNPWLVYFDKGDPINWWKDVRAMIKLAKDLFDWDTVVDTDNNQKGTSNPVKKQDRKILKWKEIAAVTTNNSIEDNISIAEEKTDQMIAKKLEINEDLMDKILNPDNGAHISNVIENIFDNENFLLLLKNIEKTVIPWYTPDIDELRNAESDNWYPLFNINYLSFLIWNTKKYYPEMDPFTSIAICHSESRFKGNAQHGRTKASWLFQFLGSTANHLSNKIYHGDLWNKDDKVLQKKNEIKAIRTKNLNDLWIPSNDVTWKNIQYDPIISATSSLFYLYRRGTNRWNEWYTTEKALWWYNPSTNYKNTVMWKMSKISM